MAYLFIIAGLILLVLGGNWLVKGAVDLALILKVSTVVIGLTVVSLATSAPELLVSVQASLKGYPAITVGNVIGSNIANIALILGLTAMIFKLPIDSPSYRFDFLYMILAYFAFYFLVWDGKLGVIEGAVLTFLLIAYNTYKIRSSRKRIKKILAESSEIPEKPQPLYKIVLYILIGIVALRFGADFLVDGAVQLAEKIGVDDRIISVTVVAVGTSIPELAASIVAAFKKEQDLAVGNLIGSNIFNILFVLGASSLISYSPLFREIPIRPPQLITFDFWWMVGLSLPLAIPIYLLYDKIIKRWQGAILFGGYLVYLYLIF